LGKKKLDQLITPAYVQEQQLLHQDPTYGAGSHRYAHLLIDIMRQEKCETILDYGAGKGTLAKVIHSITGMTIAEYDPGVPGKEQAPAPADLVACIDVMEHIEPFCLDAVIQDLARLTRKRLFLDIATKFDKHRWLTDGRNSHQIVNEGGWWSNRFEKYGFKTRRHWNTGMRAWIVLMSC
jgi:hypothetical protein